jgi:hypothetical protein
MCRISSVGRRRPAVPHGRSGTQDESAETSAKRFPATRHFPRDGGDTETENAPQKIHEMQGLSSYLNYASALSAGTPACTGPDCAPERLCSVPTGGDALGPARNSAVSPLFHSTETISGGQS